MIATEYAKSLYDVHKDHKLALEEFEILNRFLPDLNPIMASPNITKEEKRGIIKKSLKDFDDDFIYFIYVVIDNQRFNLLNDICNEFKKMCYKENNIILVDVFLSKELTDNEEKDIISFLSNRINKKIVLNKIIDNSICGIKILYEGNSIDYTIEARLKNMKSSL